MYFQMLYISKVWNKCTYATAIIEGINEYYRHIYFAFYTEKKCVWIKYGMHKSEMHKKWISGA